MKKKHLFYLFIIVSFFSCKEDNILNIDTSDNPILETDLSLELGNNDYNILFLGNSLTATNNLPNLVAIEAAKINLSIGFRSFTFPNFSLQNHWIDAEFIELVETGLFDYVIVQQGPSSTIEEKESLIEYGGLISNVCENNNSQLVYFTVWPSVNNLSDFSKVINNYREASEINNTMLAPVGEVWNNYINQTGVLDYYGSDGFHPSIKGSKVAAEIITETLFN